MTILVVLGFIGIMFVSSILNGWAFSILWGWFVVPLFSLPVLSVPAAIGLAMCVSFVAHHQTFQKDAETDTTKAITYSIVKPFAALLVGYIVKQFI